MSETPEPANFAEQLAVESYVRTLEHAMGRIESLERQRDAYAETLRDLLNFAYERERDYIRERHPELAQEESQT